MKHRAAFCLLVAATAIASDCATQAPVVASIDRYCSKTWRRAHMQADDRSECTQAVYLELLLRMEQDQWETALEDEFSEERRELNRAVWCVLQRWKRTRRHAALPQDGQVADRKPAQSDGWEHERELLGKLLSQLSSRQELILVETMKGASVASIAEQLETTSAIVSDEKYKAIRKLKKLIAAQSDEDVA